MRRYKLLCVKQTIRIYMHAKSLQLCLTLCDPMDSSPPGSSVHGILQVRILDRIAVPSSRRSSQLRGRTHLHLLLPSSPTLQADSLSPEPPGKAR